MSVRSLVFATNNKGKLAEASQLIGDKFEIVSLQKMGFEEDIPEPHDTLEANALEKARVIHAKFGLNCFSEDTGLEIAALSGRPGVHSARYAGEERSSEANMNLVLSELGDSTNRDAQFRTVVALIFEEREYLFEGIAKGEILKERSGQKGFGYDPIFRPLGHQESFAEMDALTKNKISHRGKAIVQLIDFLNQQ